MFSSLTHAILWEEQLADPLIDYIISMQFRRTPDEMKDQAKQVNCLLITRSAISSFKNAACSFMGNRFPRSKSSYNFRLPWFKSNMKARLLLAQFPFDNRDYSSELLCT